MSADDSPPRVDPKALLAAVDKALERELKKGPGRALSAYEVIVSNIGRIREMKVARFTDAQIVRFLSEIGITVSLGTFANYYSKALAHTGQSVSRKRGRPSREAYAAGQTQAPAPTTATSSPLPRPVAPVCAPAPTLNASVDAAQTATRHQQILKRIADEGDDTEPRTEVKVSPSRKLSRPL